MKFTLNILDRRGDDEERRWPSYIFGGRMRTSTLALMVAFLVVWWVYSAERPREPAHDGPPATQVVPPGFVPDPNYTWVPRTVVQQPPPSVTSTPTPTPTTTVPPTTTPAPFTPPKLPCLLPAPFCPPSASPTTSSPQLPQPGPGQVPTSAPPAG